MNELCVLFSFMCLLNQATIYCTSLSNSLLQYSIIIAPTFVLVSEVRCPIVLLELSMYNHVCGKKLDISSCTGCEAWVSVVMYLRC